MGSDMFVESYEIQIKLRQTLISKRGKKLNNVSGGKIRKVSNRTKQ